MKVLELFCGTKSISNVAEERGHRVFTVDNDSQFGPDDVADILCWSPELLPFAPDMIWASPPCTTFSVMSIGKHWNIDHTPKTKEAEHGMKIVKKTISIIEYFEKINPRLIWYIENPRGKLRKLDFMQKFMRKTVTYCQYGDTRMKPTDIWTNNFLWNPKPLCKNGDPCHISAPRGSHTEGSTQGKKGAIERARIPDLFREEIIRSTENVLKGR